LFLFYTAYISSIPVRYFYKLCMHSYTLYYSVTMANQEKGQPKWPLGINMAYKVEVVE